MSKTSKFAFLAALVATSIISPVLAAQSRDWSDGRHAYGMVTRNGLNAYGMVTHNGPEHQDLNSPLLNGGGSSGYNGDEKIH
jgi:hypothetical protein